MFVKTQQTSWKECCLKAKKGAVLIRGQLHPLMRKGQIFKLDQLFSWTSYRIYPSILCAPMYNARLCIIRNPFFRLHLEKKKEAENRGCRFAKLVLKIMFWTHFKKVHTIIFLEISLNAQAIHETISSSKGFFWCSVDTVKSWIPSAIHCIQPFHYSRNTKGYRTEANLRGTRAELVLWSNMLYSEYCSHISVTRS